MVQGLERRQASETNIDRSLRSSAVIKPVNLPQTAGAAASPRLPSVQVGDGILERVANNFGSYAQGVLGKAVAKDQERRMLDGAMASHQGKTFEEVEMGGDKFALEGYRLVEAQNIASSILIAQRQEVAEGAFEMDPEAYRATVVNRVSAAMDGSADPRMRRLVQETLTKQMPVLADEHMTRHLQWKEEKNFEALTKAVDVVSTDPTGHDALLAMAEGGPDSPTAGLSEDRRRDAITSGIVRAFENDNPQAYAILSATGKIKELPVEHQRSIRAAQSAFEQRNRKTYNAQFIEDERDIMSQLANGAIEPRRAMEMYGDLMATHGMTMTQQEAGAIYDSASQGVRTRKITTSAAVQEAMVRGDQPRAVDMILKSLEGTESSGVSTAFRTNKDRRSFGGLIQMGKARLADYTKATGQAITVEQFKNMSREEQQVVNRWHVNDILNRINKAGVDDMIGKTINGVTVTYSGLVAVAHLGGFGGMLKYVRTAGTSEHYDPADELGTSLTDYLRKHGNGVELTPAQAAKEAQTRLATVQEVAAVSEYEDMQAQLDVIDTAYKDGLDKEAWQFARRDVFQQYGKARTMADVKFERGLTEEVLADAAAQLSEAQQLAAGAAIESASLKFEDAVSAFEEGKIGQAEMVAAQQEFATTRHQVQQEHGIKLSADAEIKEIRAQSKRLREAMDARAVFDQEQVDIDKAVVSGTLDELSPKLQERAIAAQEQRVSSIVQDQLAMYPTERMSPQEAGDLHNALMMDWYAQTGAVNPKMERVMNGFLSGSLTDAAGNPSESYVEAAEQYRGLLQRNSTLADRYVRPENRPLLDTVLDIAGTGPIETAVATLGRRMAQAPRAVPTAEFMADPDTVERVDAAVSAVLHREDIGVAQAVFSSANPADLQQVRNQSWFDRFDVWDDANQQLLRDRVTKEVSTGHARNPLLTPSELASSARRRVEERTPILGGIAVTLPMDGPSAGERFYGARASDMTDKAGAINRALMDHFRSDEFLEKYPFANDIGFAESLPVWMPDSINVPLLGEIPIRGEAGTPEDAAKTLFTGVRPFQVFHDGVTDSLRVTFMLPNGTYSDAIQLDERAIGDADIKRQSATAAQ